MQEQIDTLLEKIKTDYVNWSTSRGKSPYLVIHRVY